MNEHEIRRAQAVTRWVEGVESRGQYRTRDGSIKNNRTDAEYVADHIKATADYIQRLEAENQRLRELVADKMTELDQEMGLQ